jgi:Cu/Ag efflux protein CusF
MLNAKLCGKQQQQQQQKQQQQQQQQQTIRSITLGHRDLNYIEILLMTMTMKI